MVTDKTQRSSLTNTTAEVTPLFNSKSRYSSYQMFGKNNVIPKVIDKFQKATPKKQPQNYNNTSKKSSIQTLYRNTRSTVGGKTVTKHKLMDELLQNVAENSDHESITSPTIAEISSSQLTYRNIADKSANKKEFYSTEFRLSEKIKPAISCITSTYSRVDKSTSITGLNPNQLSTIKGKVGIRNNEPAVQKGKNPNQGNNNSYNFYNKSKNAFPLAGKKTKDSFTSSSFIVEEYPTRDLPNRPLPELCKASVQGTDKKYLGQSNRQILPEKLEKPNDDYIVKNVAPKRSKEKSFVKIQVEKLNKITNSGIYGRKTTTQNANQNKKGAIQGHKKDPNKGYLHLMNAVRKSVPKIDKSKMPDASTDYNHEWSDCNTDVLANPVKFPKETKYAMEQCLKERRAPLQLSKFTTKYSENFRPAIFIDHDDYISSNGVNFTRNQTLDPSKRIDTYEEKRSQKNFGPSHKITYNQNQETHSKKIPLAREKIKLYDSRPTREFVRNSRDVRNVHNVQKTYSGIPLRKKNTNNIIPCSKNLLCDRGDHNGPCNVIPQVKNKCV